MVLLYFSLLASHFSHKYLSGLLGKSRQAGTNQNCSTSARSAGAALVPATDQLPCVVACLILSLLATMRTWS